MDEPPIHSAEIGGLLGGTDPPRRSGALRDAALAELVGELTGRLQDGVLSSEDAVSLGIGLEHTLRVSLDVHMNRMSARRYRDIFGLFEAMPRSSRFDIRGKTVLDLGCGALNPFGVGFLFVMLGARRAIAVDPAPIENLPRAVRALADCAALMLIDPARLVGQRAITRRRVLGNLASFDLAKLGAGDRAGLNTSRLRHLAETADRLSLDDGEVDLLISNAFLEHVTDMEDVAAELARITRSGGYHVHGIDGSDHRRYLHPDHHPLEFLTEASDGPLVHGCNRLRPLEFCGILERHGFELLDFHPFEHTEIDDTLRERLVGPFRGMPDEMLRPYMGALYMRRV